MKRRSFLLGTAAAGLGAANVWWLTWMRRRRRLASLERTIARKERDEEVCAIGFDLRGNRLASATGDDLVSIWNPASGKSVSTTRARHGASITGISFLSRDSWVATASKDKLMKLRKPAADVESVGVLFKSEPTCVALNPADGNCAVGLSDCTIRVVDCNTAVELAVLRGHSGKVNALSFPLNGRLLASASDDGTVKLWDTGPWDLMLAYSPPFAPLPTAKKLMFSEREATATLAGHGCPVNSVSLSRDGTRLASADAKGIIVVWDTNRRTQLGSLRGHKGPVLATDFFLDSNWLMSTAADKTTRLWSIAKMREALDLPANPGKHSAIAFSTNGRYFASAWEREVRFWNADKLISDGKRRLGLG